MSATNLTAAGASWLMAKAISGNATNGTVTATGTVIGDAAAITAQATVVTGAASAGVQLPDEEGFFVLANHTAATLVYPHSASGIINGGSAGAAVTVGSGKGCICVRIDNLNWALIGDAA